MTVLEVIRRSTEYLADKGVDSPRLQTELLLAHVLRLPRMQLYLNFERVLGPAETDELRTLVKRRGQREPLQHILGSTSFCGLEIAVNRHVLVPRPETELLAEQGWNFLRACQASRSGDRSSDGVTPKPPEGGTPDLPQPTETTLSENEFPQPSPAGPSGPVALDFGTGSGCLAVTLAVKCPGAVVYALEISTEALEVARQNAERHGVSERIRFVLGDGFAALPCEARFDLIISNPPYIPTAEIPGLQPEVRDYDPRQALDGGPEGMSYYRRLAAEASAWLKPNGKLMLEFGDGQAESLRAIFQQQNWIVESVLEDYAHKPRILVAGRN